MKRAKTPKSTKILHPKNTIKAATSTSRPKSKGKLKTKKPIGSTRSVEFTNIHTKKNSQVPVSKSLNIQDSLKSTLKNNGQNPQIEPSTDEERKANLDTYTDFSSSSETTFRNVRTWQ